MTNKCNVVSWDRRTLGENRGDTNEVGSLVNNNTPLLVSQL